ncbi:MAG: DUF2194 domain-containing protein, partial [Deltaproteobacteria bacterium]|nr:DUF2194 domain-containing protein [Deltaproteobacteria bacterium]
GGGIISLNPVTSHALYPLFSLNGNHQKKLKKGFGMDFAGIFYPEANKFNVAKDGYQFSGIDIKQPPGSELLISAHKSGEKEALVMAFMVRKGKGRAVFLNNLDAGSRYFTGMLAQLLIHALDTAAVPLFAIRTLFVDDCPLPMWNREVEGEEKTDTEFYLKDFFEEIVSLSDRFKIKPSFFAVFSYDDRVEPPFDFTQFQIGKDNASLELAGKIMDHGFELGLHGYNHLSLALSGGVSKPWKSGESMEKALLSVRKYWTERFGGGNLPVVYVAPNNYIDAAGKKAIKNAIPEIRVISALMNGDENETSQDIGFDSEEPHFFNLPRTSAGYMLGGEQKLSLINGIMLAGFWTHFIHPDDAYDPARSQKFKWKDLIASFRKVFEDVEKSYPFLRAMTARDAFYEAMKISDTGFNFKSSAKKIGYEITPGTESPFFMLLKIPAGSKIKKTEGFEKISYNMKSGYMFVKTIGHRGSVLYD